MAERKHRTQKGIVYKGSNRVSLEEVPFPSLTLKSDVQERDCPHGVILKVITSGICGADLHVYRGRTTTKEGMQLGHEITGEVIQVGPHVEFIKEGDLVSVPFTVACGKCRNCKEGKTNLCLTANPTTPGGFLGYVDGGGWLGGQSEYLMVPWADFNLLKLCDANSDDKPKVMERMLDISLLSDVLPTGFHGAVTAGVKPGRTVYIAGAGPVGMACAACCKHLLGASVVIVGDVNHDRLMHAKSLGLDVADLSSTVPLIDQIEMATGGIREVDCMVDCIGYEAKGHGAGEDFDNPSQVMNDGIDVIRSGGCIGCIGAYFPNARHIQNESIKEGKLLLDFGLGWTKGFCVKTGLCPVMKYHYDLFRAIMADQIPVAKYVNATVVPLTDAVKAYERFNEGEPRKFILDPHGMLQQHHGTTH